MIPDLLQRFLHFSMLVIALTPLTSAHCQGQDYSPCLCLGDDPSPEIFCSIKNASDIAAIRQAFQRSTVEDHEQVAFEIVYPLAIPADLLGGKQARQIHLYGRLSNKFSLDKLDVDVFRSSDESTEELYIYDCDTANADWSFLRNFNVLKKIFIRNSFVRNLAALPPLRALENLHIGSSWGLESWQWPEEHAPHLNSITIIDAYQLDKNRVNQIVDDFPVTLSSVELSASKLTQIPRKLRRLTGLKTLDLSKNAIQLLSAVSLPTMSRPDSINLRGNGLRTIEANAFRGEFPSTRIDLSSNQLTTLDASVFFPVLNSMVNGTGYVYLYNNPINCDCSLAWLGRDHRTLMPHVWNAFCSDGTSFDSLQAENFENCP